VDLTLGGMVINLNDVVPVLQIGRFGQVESEFVLLQSVVKTVVRTFSNVEVVLLENMDAIKFVTQIVRSAKVDLVGFKVREHGGQDLIVVFA